MTLEEKVAAYVKLREELEKLENQKKLLGVEILKLMPKDTINVHIPGYRVKRASLLSIKISLENAKQLGAIRMKEVIDKEKIKQLYEEGQSPPGVSEIHFIQVYSIDKVNPVT